MLKPLVWEQIDSYHQRCEVVGGWLVKAYEDVYEDRGFGAGLERGYNWNVSMCFVPDPTCIWNLKEDRITPDYVPEDSPARQTS